MSRLGIDIVVEAGDWPPEPLLRDLARRAVAAAVAAMEAGALHASPLSVSPPQGGREGASPPPLRRRVRERGKKQPPRELSIVFTDDAAMRKLNQKWRGKDSPTNVLSFPQLSGLLLGDVVLSAETIAREAALADKTLEDHMAHLIIHAYLHLLGFDHEAERDAAKMEQLERVALKILGIDDPYAAAS